MTIYLPVILLATTLHVTFVTPPGETYTAHEQAADLAAIHAALDYWQPWIQVDQIQIHHLTIDDPEWHNNGWGFYRSHMQPGYNLFMVDNSNSRKLWWYIAAGWADPDRHAVIQVRAYPDLPVYERLTTAALFAHEAGHMWLRLPDQFTPGGPDIMSWPVDAWEAQILGACTGPILWQQPVPEHCATEYPR